MIRMLTALATATALVALATPAQAEPLALECVGAKSTNYSPGPTFTPVAQLITFEATYAPCAGTDASVTSAALHPVADDHRSLIIRRALAACRS